MLRRSASDSSTVPVPAIAARSSRSVRSMSSTAMASAIPFLSPNSAYSTGLDTRAAAAISSIEASGPTRRMASMAASSRRVRWAARASGVRGGRPGPRVVEGAPGMGQGSHSPPGGAVIARRSSTPRSAGLVGHRAGQGPGGPGTPVHMHVELTRPAPAPAAAVWSVVADVERWPMWTRSMPARRAADGRPPPLGSRVQVKQPRLAATTWVVTELEPRTVLHLAVDQSRHHLHGGPRGRTRPGGHGHHPAHARPGGSARRRARGGLQQASSVATCRLEAGGSRAAADVADG